MTSTIFENMLEYKKMDGFNKNKSKPYILTAIIALWGLTAISFVVTPFAGDIRVFMASANQSNYISSNLIVGAYKAWELKSVFSRTLMFFIYKIATLFTDFGTYGFEIASKIIYLLFIEIMVFGSMVHIFREDKLSCLKYGLLTSLGFMAIYSGCQMQVEMTCSLLILMAFSLYLNAIKTQKKYILKLIVAGILIGSLFFFKSVLILLSVSVVAAICICNINEGRNCSFNRMLWVVVGSIGILLLNAGLILLINPNEFKDIIDASHYQNTLISNNFSLWQIGHASLRFFKKGIYNLAFIPVLVLGVVTLAFNLIECIKKRKWTCFFFHIVMWAMPALFVILSNCYFVYHYASFIFPSVAEMYFCISSERVRVWKIISRTVAVIIVIWYIVNFSIFSYSVLKSIKYDKKAYEGTECFLSNIDFDKSSVVLYLDDGQGAYILGNKSYIRYFFPLPLQRLNEESKLNSYMESKQQTMAYKGKYVSVYESWFFNGKNEDIKRKLMTEYRLIGEYPVFSPAYSLGTSNIEVRYYDLYERKNQTK